MQRRHVMRPIGLVTGERFAVGVEALFFRADERRHSGPGQAFFRFAIVVAPSLTGGIGSLPSIGCT